MSGRVDGMMNAAEATPPTTTTMKMPENGAVIDTGMFITLVAAVSTRL
jgi:hypothetical protein